MRVVAGEKGGLRLMAPPGTNTRPTADSVREAVFNAIASRLDLVGARVLDLFAGSGALGIEALSRGAVSATFVDRDHAAACTIEANLEATGARGGKVVRSAVERWLAGRESEERWSLVLADPPYAFDGWDEMLGLLRPHMDEDGLAVFESDRELELPKGWRSVRSKRYGTTLVDLAVPCHHPCAETG